MGEGELWDVVVIGGGPAGATAATFLARAGLQVRLFEGDEFPRPHIGESLLPASVPIFQRLGVEGEIARASIHKPGGKWVYGSAAIYGDFAVHEPDCSFARTPYAYMVDRPDFDALLLDNARCAGAAVQHKTQVIDLLWRDARAVGVRVRDASGRHADVRARMVLDCSGERTLIGSRLKTRQPNRLRRVAVYAHYRAKALDPELANGWFVGQVIRDGWVWLIPLDAERISVGAVVGLADYRESRESPERFLERLLTKTEFLRRAISSEPERIGPIHVTGRMGHSAERFAGEGWAVVGDAAFFVDPCFSSGVHLALLSAEEVAETLIACFEEGREPTLRDLLPYQEKLRRHEEAVTQMVEGFYVVTRNRTLHWVLPRLRSPRLERQFGTFIGGDFSQKSDYVRSTLRAIRSLDRVLP